MNSLPTPATEEPSTTADRGECVPKLIGQVYASAPPCLRAKMLEHLMRPLGILSLMAVANGVFASIRLRNPSIDPQVPLEDTAAIQPNDVVNLANWVQQVSIEAFDGLIQVLSASPALTKSTAVAMLLSLLVQLARQHNPQSQDH